MKNIWNINNRELILKVHTRKKNNFENTFTFIKSEKYSEYEPNTWQKLWY